MHECADIRVQGPIMSRSFAIAVDGHLAVAKNAVCWYVFTTVMREAIGAARLPATLFRIIGCACERRPDALKPGIDFVIDTADQTCRI